MGIKQFKFINENDIAGGKGSNLAKMYQNGFNIPNGFIITADLFNDFLNENNVTNIINNLIEDCNFESQDNLEDISNKILTIINNCKITPSIENQILNNYKELNCKYVAVRSSATSEDGREHAWAGTLETFLNVDKESIIECIKKCWCSIYKPRALFYRLKNEKDSNIAVAVVVQEMVQSEISGVAFSSNPINNKKDEIVIEAVLGLGEAIVSGAVTPDKYITDKNSKTIKEININNQKKQLVQNNNWQDIKNGNCQKLSNDLILKLSDLIIKIENFYNFPVDIEWVVQNNKIYVLQTRPITTIKENSLIKKICEKGNWTFYVSRKFNWFVENTEIYATLEEYQKKLLGFELITQNYLCLNGDEYSLNSDFEAFCKKLDGYFENDINFFEKFAKIEFDIVEKIKEYLKYIKSIDFNKISFNELAIEFEKFNKLYIDSFIPGMTRPEDYLTFKLNEELSHLNISKQDKENIFTNISTCPNYDVISYSEEPLDLLKIAKKLKCGLNIDALLDEHIEKYAWIKGPLEYEATCFTKEDYLQRLKNLVNEDIDAKINNINIVRNKNDLEYEQILKKYTFSEKQKNLIKAIRDFIFLRTYTTEYSDHLFYEARTRIFKEISNRINISEQDLIMLDFNEIIEILLANGIIKNKIKKVLEDRKKGFAIVWLDGNIQTVFGAESLDIQNEIAKKFKTIDVSKNNVKTNIISGNIANKGKVQGVARVLTTYKDIYKVNKGDIIVASMTTPDYVLAMEKAAGFITDEGGITCHAAILSREFNVPCIVGTINATSEIKDGDLIELDAYNGKIYILNQ